MIKPKKGPNEKGKQSWGGKTGESFKRLNSDETYAAKKKNKINPIRGNATEKKGAD